MMCIIQAAPADDFCLPTLIPLFETVFLANCCPLAHKMCWIIKKLNF